MTRFLAALVLTLAVPGLGAAALTLSQMPAHAGCRSER